MRQSPPLLPHAFRRRAAAVLWSTLALFAAAALPGAVRAERADRDKPMEIVADRSSTVDLANQVGRFNGNVVITQGTMSLRADRVEVRETPDGYRSGTAWGSPTAQVIYRQKRDGVNEYVEGQADRVEFDGRSEVLRFVGKALVRRIAGGTTLDEITGELITWNHGAEQFSVQSGTPGTNSPDGRVRAVLAPRSRTPGAAASAPRSR